MTQTISDTFVTGSGPTNGAQVTGYLASRFSTPPTLNSSPPGSYGADTITVTTGTDFGGPGQFRLPMTSGPDRTPTNEPFYVSFTYNGQVSWKYYSNVNAEDGGRGSIGIYGLLNGQGYQAKNFSPGTLPTDLATVSQTYGTQGAQGAQGTQGPQGPQGAQGSGTNLASYFVASNYGVSTSSSDNTAAIQSWLDAAGAAKGIAWIDSGTYVFSGQLNINYSELTIQGHTTAGFTPTTSLKYTGAAGAGTIASTTSYSSFPTSITLAAGNSLLASGTGVIESNVGNLTFTYTGNSGNVLTGVTFSFTNAFSYLPSGISQIIFAAGGKVWNPVINGRKRDGIRFNNLGLIFNNNAFNGVLVDLSGDGLALSPAYGTNHYFNGCIIGKTSPVSVYTGTLLNLNCGYTFVFANTQFIGGATAIQGVSSTSGANLPSTNFVNGMTIANGCSFASHGDQAILNPGYACTIVGPTVEPSASNVANFLVADWSGGTQLNDALNLTGGYYNDATSGSWITWRGGSISITGIGGGLAGSKLLTCTNFCGAISITGTSWTDGGSNTIIDGGNYAHNSVTIISNNWKGATAPVAGMGSAVTYLYETSAGTHYIDNISTSSVTATTINSSTGAFSSQVTVPLNAGPNTMGYNGGSYGTPYTDAATFKTSAGGWIEFSGTGSRSWSTSNPVAPVGSGYSLAGTVTSSATSSISLGQAYSATNPPSLYLSPVVAGTSYTFIAYVKATDGNPSRFYVNARWLTSSGAIVSNANSSTLTTSSAWQKSTFTATAPATAAYVSVLIYFIPPAGTTYLVNGQVVYISCISVSTNASSLWAAPNSTSSTGFSTSGILGGGQPATNFASGVNSTDLATVGQLPTLASLNGFPLTGGTITGSLDISGAGNGLKVAEGSNAKQGTATLSAGTVTVSNTSVTATSRIFLTVQSLGTVAVPQALAVTARTAGTSFTITSASITDTSVVAYEIFEVG